jgi:predicted RNA-binding protein
MKIKNLTLIEKKNNYILFIMSKENLPMILGKKVIGIKRRYFKSLRELSKGDEFIIYIKGKEIIGVFELASNLFQGQSLIFPDEVYPLRFRIKKRGRTKIKIFINQLIPKLDFIKNKKYWTCNIQGKPFILLSRKDFKLLEDYLHEK